MAHGQGGAEIGFDRSPTLTCNHEAPIVAHSLRGEGFDASEDGTGRGTPLVPVNVPEIVGTMKACKDSGGWSNSADHAAAGYMIPVAFSCKDHGADAGEIAPTLRSMNSVNSNQNGGGQVAVAFAHQSGGTQTTLGYDETSGVTQTLSANQTPAVAIRTANTGANGHGIAEEVAHTLDQAQGQAIALAPNTQDEVRLQGGDGQVCGALSADPGMKQTTSVAYDILGVPATKGAKETDIHVPLRARQPDQSKASTTTVIRQAMQVRRLTPRECERLQGFPDDYTQIQVRGKPAADGARYKALGNSMAVPVMAWIGRRIAQVDAIPSAHPQPTNG